MRRWLASLSVLIILVGLAAALPAHAQIASATAGRYGANVYAGPGQRFWLHGTLASNETVPVIGVTADQMFWQVNTAKGMGYVFSGDVTVTGGATVPVIDPGPIGTVTAPILTVRRGPGITAARIGLLSAGSQFFLLATQENSNWIEIHSFVGIGWVNGTLTSLSASIIAANGTANGGTPAATAPANVPVVSGPRAIVNTSALNVHTGPGVTFTVIGTLNGGDVVPIIGQTPDGTWIYVDSIFGKGWINFSLVIPKDYNGNAPVVTVAPSATKDAFVIVLTGTVNVHSGPNIAFGAITTENAGTKLPLLGQSRDLRWWYVDTPAGKGWISKSLVEATGAVSSVPIVTP